MSKNRRFWRMPWYGSTKQQLAMTEESHARITMLPAQRIYIAFWIKSSTDPGEPERMFNSLRDAMRWLIACHMKRKLLR